MTTKTAKINVIYNRIYLGYSLFMTQLGMPRRNSRQGFTLVELLTVLGIMSILAVVTMSSFAVLKTTSLSGAGNQMGEVLNMARQNAISRGNSTAVVVKTTGTSAYSAYCIMEYNNTTGAWSNLTAWKYLPPGILFQHAATDKFFNNSVLTQLGITNIMFQGIVSSDTFAAQCFQSDGSLYGGTATNLKVVPQESATTGTAVNYYNLVVVANSGVVKVERP